MNHEFGQLNLEQFTQDLEEAAPLPSDELTMYHQAVGEAYFFFFELIDEHLEALGLEAGAHFESYPKVWFVRDEAWDTLVEKYPHLNFANNSGITITKQGIIVRVFAEGSISAHWRTIVTIAHEIAHWLSFQALGEKKRWNYSSVGFASSVVNPELGSVRFVGKILNEGIIQLLSLLFMNNRESKVIQRLFEQLKTAAVAEWETDDSFTDEELWQRMRDGSVNVLIDNTANHNYQLALKIILLISQILPEARPLMITGLQSGRARYRLFRLLTDELGRETMTKLLSLNVNDEMSTADLDDLYSQVVLILSSKR